MGNVTNQTETRREYLVTLRSTNFCKKKTDVSLLSQDTVEKAAKPGRINVGLMHVDK